MAASSLVDPKVSRIKFDKEVNKLMMLSSELRRKGWIIESTEFPIVRVTYLTTKVKPTVAPFTVEIDFTNYNILPLSVRFLNPITFEPTIANGYQWIEGKPINIVITKHPQTGLAFLCMVGVQEYHSHPQHNGDVWDIYRYSEKGSLYYILDKIWLYCINTIKYFITPQIQIPNILLKCEEK